MEKITVRQISYGSGEYEQSLELRNKVLRQPFGADLYREDLSGDKDDRHFAAFEGNRLVGTMTLVKLDGETAKIRQVAVEPELQGRKIGQLVSAFVEDFARGQGFREIVVHARKTALGFYEKMGYVIASEEFLEVGIPHRKMEKVL